MSEINLVEDIPQEPSPTQRTHTQMIPISELVVSEANVRKEYMHYKELIPSIEKFGIKEPIDVWYNKVTGNYEIMNGQNRFYAARELNISEIEAIIYNDIISLEDAHKWCITKQVLGKDISKLDKKRLANQLDSMYGGNLKLACSELNLPYRTLYEWWKLPPEILELDENDLEENYDIRSLREVSRAETPDQRRLLLSEIREQSRSIAINHIHKRLEEWHKLDSPTPRVDYGLIKTWAERGIGEELNKQWKICRELGLEIVGPVYGAWKPDRETLKILVTIIGYLKEMYNSNGPETIRHVYYHLVSIHLIPEDEGQYNKVSRIVTDARRAGLIKYEWIDDKSRTDIIPPSWESVDDYIMEKMKYFRTDWCKGQLNYAEVFTEKRTLLNKLDLAWTYFGVPLICCGGFESDTNVEEAANRFRERYLQDFNCVVLYFGDVDPSGKGMIKYLREEWRKRGVPVKVIPVMLNVNQVSELGLDWAKRKCKESDTRSSWYKEEFGIDWSVEIDAVDTRTIQQYLVGALTQYLDLSLLEKSKEKDKEQIEEWLRT